MALWISKNQSCQLQNDILPMLEEHKAICFFDHPG